MGGATPLRFGKNACRLTHAPRAARLAVRLDRKKARLALRLHRLGVRFDIFGKPPNVAHTSATLEIARA